MNKLMFCKNLAVIFFNTILLFAQDPRSLFKINRYNEVIQQLSLKTNINLEEKMLLVNALKARGDLLQDAADLMLELGYRAYTNPNVKKTRHTAYFLGRYAFEMGEKDLAIDCFQKSFQLESPYAELAVLWKEAASTGTIKTMQSPKNIAWVAAEYEYIRSCFGVEVIPPAVPGNSAAEKRLQLWHLSMIIPHTFSYLKNTLYQSVPPDIIDKVILVDDNKAGMQVPIPFYDPMTYRLMARADYVAAMRLAQTVNNDASNLVAGMCSYSAGLFHEAESFLRSSNHPIAKIYKGGIAASQGDSEAAKKLWQASLSTENNKTVITELCRIAGKFNWNGLTLDPWSALKWNQSGAARLANVYIDRQMPGKAVNLLESLADHSRKNSLNAHNPSYLVVQCRAEIANKRYDEFLGKLIELKSVYPFLNALHEIAALAIEAKGEGGIKNGI